MSPTAKVTYISLSADDPALDAAFEAAIARRARRARPHYPLHVAGETRAGAAPIESRSPADTRVVVARVATATAADVNDAVAAARAAFPRWSAHALAGARGDPRSRRRHRPRAPARAGGLADLRDGQEPRRGAGRDRGDRRSLRVLRRADARERRLRARDGQAGPDRPQHQRAAPLRRVGRRSRPGIFRTRCWARRRRRRWSPATPW